MARKKNLVWNLLSAVDIGEAEPKKESATSPH